MTISAILRQASYLAVFIMLAGWMPSFAQTAYDIHKEIPLRFSYRGAGTGGFEKDTGWIWLGGLLESKMYLSKMNVPVAVSISGRMIIECRKGEIYPGNMTACRAWIESQDDPDVPELSTNYGYTLGVKFRDLFSETELADVGKDFALKIAGNGPMPLGGNLICGIDYLEFASFPVSQFIPDTKTIQKVAKKIVGAAGIGTVRLAGELVVEGNYVALHMADASLKFYGFRDTMTYPDPADDPQVKTFALTVPSASRLEDSPLYNAASKTLFYEPIIQYSFNLYNTAGLEFSLIGPLHFNFMPTVITQGANLLSYACPDPATLHNGSFYNKAADDFKITSERPIVVSFPLTDTPNLPDIAITEVRFNGTPDGEVFADEWTAIDFTMTNIGERDTVGSPEPLFTYSLFLDGQIAPDPLFPGYTMAFRWLDDVPQDLYKGPLVTLAKNASHRVGSFVYKFPEGPHKLEISTGYNEYKTTQNGQPVYGIGDYHVANNFKIARQFMAQPKRGTVLGRIITNPCAGDCGVNGIQVCLKDAAAGGYYECQATRSISGNEGAYRFEAVPTGDYTLEYRPAPPSAEQIAAGTPYYAPRSFSFHHDGRDTDDFNYNTTRSGMALFQYQSLTGHVHDQSNNPIAGVAVQLGIADVGPFGPTATTDANGRFTFTRGLSAYDGSGQLISSGIPPPGDYTLTFRHDLYQPKEIQFHLSVSESTQTETMVTNAYWDPDVNPHAGTSGPIKLTPDTTPPALTVHPLAAEGFGSTALNLEFLASDTNGKAVKQYRYTVYYGTSGAAHGAPSDWIAYPAPDTTNPDALVTAAVDIGAPLAEGAHRLYVEVSDGANVTGASIHFTKDASPPVISSVRFMDPLTLIPITATTGRQADVALNMANVETGLLTAWLSNDNLTWTGPFAFTGTETTIKQWSLTDRETYTRAGHKVYAKVRDLAGNESAVADGAINVDTSGAVLLAGGALYTDSAVVPMSIDISPPPGVLISSETGAGSKIALGDTAATQYLAQTITLDTAKTFNFIKLNMSYDAPPPVAGAPGPLNIKIVSGLPQTDPPVAAPANTSLVLAQWSFAAADVSALVKTYGHLPLSLAPSLTLNAGTYYLLVYTEAVDAGNHYALATGYYPLLDPTAEPEAHERYDFIPAQAAWVPQRDIMSIYTLAHEIRDNEPGQIRIAADGNCTGLTGGDWIDYVFPAVTQRFVDFSAIDAGAGAGVGLQTVCVEYRHPTIHEKDGRYYDAVIIDTTAPTGTVSFRSVEKDAKVLHLDLAATDTASGVASVVWRAGGTWTLPEPYGTTLKIPNLAVDTVEVKFIDKAGNESDIYAVTLPEDIFDPVLFSFAINDGSGFTTNPLLNFHINAVDNQNLAGIFYRETITGTKGEIAAAGAAYHPDPPDTIALPKVNVNGTEVWLDGVYEYSLQARDAAGNRSAARRAAVTLDRQAPTIKTFHLKGFDGRALTTVPAFDMILDSRDAFGPLLMRYSLDNTNWTAWQAIEPRESILRIDAPGPMPAGYTLFIEVKDGAGNTAAAQAAIRTNRPPATPVGGSPAGTTFSDSPRITPTPFYDADGDAQEASWFLVRKADDQTIIVNTLPVPGSSVYTLSLSELSYDVGYTWSARYLDSFGQWSSWSNPVAFVLKRPTLTVERTGSGRVESTQAGIECDDRANDCKEVYNPGSLVHLVATPSWGYVFTGWSGACSGTADCTVVMDDNKAVTAIFAPAAVPLPGDVDGSGTVDLADAVIALQVAARGTPASIEVGADVNVDGKIGLAEGVYILQALSSLRTAYLPTLIVVTSGNGAGTVTGSPAGIDCGADCSATYPAATMVTLTAVPDPVSSTFAGWFGPCMGSGTCAVSVEGIQTVGAQFNLKTWTISTSAGEGGVIVPASPVTVEHEGGQTFTITPSDGYHVADVLVDGVSVGAGTSYTFANVTENHAIAASFAQNVIQFTITATAGDHGTLEPPGKTTVNQGASQTYAITPQAGYHVEQVFVDDTVVGPVSTYTFGAVQADHAIRAVFAPDVTFATADLSGEWRLAGVSTAAVMTAPYGTIEFDAEARTTGGSLTYPDREPQKVVKGALIMDDLGVLSGEGWSLDPGTMLTIRSGKVTEAKNFMAFVGSADAGSLEMMTALKDGRPIWPAPEADLSGSWHLFGYRAGDGKDAGPLAGSLVLDAAANVAAESSLTFPGNSPLSVKGALTTGLDVEDLDILTLNSGQIDGECALMTWTDAGKSAHDFFIAVKDGGTFPRGCLEGTWYVSGLSAGTNWRGVLTMTGEGIVTGGTLIDGEGREQTIGGGEIAMAETGLIAKSALTLDGATHPIDQGKMTADVNMIVWIMETPAGTPGLMILSRGRGPR